MNHAMTTPDTAATPAATNQVVIIDAHVADAAALAAAAPAGSKVFILDGASNGVEQIGAILKSVGNVDSLHIVSHGGDGYFLLGSDVVTSETASHDAAAFQSWAADLAPGADLLFYGCDLAASAAGQGLVNQIGAWTGADVAASSNVTGASGDWVLEYQQGVIETQAMAAPAYQHDLNTYLVTTLDDEQSSGGTLAQEQADGHGLSLREALTLAMRDGKADTIIFDPAMFADGKMHTLTLDGSLDIGGNNDSDSITIIGAGSSLLTISGNHRWGIFVGSGDDAIASTVSLSGMTLSDGDANYGGAISMYQAGSLLLDHMVIKNNVGYDYAGGIRFVDQTLASSFTMRNSTISGNKATGSETAFGGGMFINTLGTTIISSSTITGNFADASGGGIQIEGKGAFSMNNSTIDGNKAGGSSAGTAQGAGIFIGTTGTSTLNNNTITDNALLSKLTPGDSGGGIIARNAGAVTLKNNFFSGNTVSNSDTNASQGGDLFVRGTAVTGSNNIIAHVGIYQSSGTSKLTGSITAVPAIGPLADNGGAVQTRALVSGTAAVNGGVTGGTLPSLDARGYDRGATIDIGAYELSNENTFKFTGSLFPATGYSYVPIDFNFTMDFGQPVAAVADKNIVIHKVAGAILETIPATDARVTISGNIVTINPTASLAHGEVYYITIDSGAFTADGGAKTFTGLTGANTWNFTAAPSTGPTTTISGVTLSADTGTSASDFLTNTAAQTVKATLSAPLVTGETLRGSVNDGATWTNITSKVSGTTINWDGVTLTGSSALKLKVVDSASLDGKITSQSYVLDTTAPTVAITSGTPQLKAGETATITFTFSEDPGSTFAWDGGAGDLTVSGGTLGAIGGSGLTRTAVFTPTAGVDSGSASIAVDKLSYTDAAGNKGGGASVTAPAYDTLAPSVSGVAAPASATYGAGQTLDFTVNFSEAVTVTTGGGTPRIAVTLDTGGTVYANYASGSGTAALVFSYTVASGDLDADGVTPGAVIDLHGGTLKDGAGNNALLTLNNVAATGGVLVEAVPPTVTSIVRVGAAATSAASVDYTVTFSESVTGVDIADFVVTGTGTTKGTVSAVTSNGDGGYTVTVDAISGDGTLRLDLKNTGTGIADAHNNAIATGYTAGESYTLDHTGPTVSAISRAGAGVTNAATNGATISYTVTFSESVTGVDAGDFALTATGTATGQIASVSGGGATYTVTVDTVAGEGTLRLDLNPAGTGIRNALQNDIATGHTGGQAYTIDHVAPAAPAAPVLAAGSDTGVSNHDGITSATAPVITGTAEADSAVTLYDGDGTTVLGTATATGGVWSITSSTLAQGAHALTVKATDAAGNVSDASPALTLAIDTAAPTAIALSATAAATIHATSGTTLATLSATDTHALTYALVAGNGTNDTGNGAFTITGDALTPRNNLSPGTYNLNARATDAAGNHADQALTFTVFDGPSVASIVRGDSLSTLAAAAATSLTYIVTFSEEVVGVSFNDFTVVRTGTATGTIAEIEYHNGVYYTVTIDGLGGDGTIGLNLNASGTGIKNQATQDLVDGYTGQVLTLDHTPPDAPGVPAMTADGDTGASSGDAITSFTTPVFTGTADADATVKLLDTDGITVLGTADADDKGKWSITSSTLAEGTHGITAIQLDAAGNVSPAGAAKTVVIDLTAPTAPALSTATGIDVDTKAGVALATLSSTDAIDTGPLSYRLTPGSSGNDADNELFRVNGNVLAPAEDLQAGTYHLHVRATDAAGNYAEQALTFTVLTGPTVSAIARADAVSAVVAASATSLTYTVTFNEAVTGVDAADFTLVTTGTASGAISDVTGSGGTYTVTVNALAGDGTLGLSLKDSGTGIRNAAPADIVGGYAGQVLTLDHTAPAAPGVPALAAGSDSGASNSDAVTSVATPVFTGTAEANATVKLFDTDGVTVLGTAGANDKGAWSITSSTLIEGTHGITAMQWDAAGNASAASAAKTIVIDTSAPTAPALSTSTGVDINTKAGVAIATLSSTDAIDSGPLTYQLTPGVGGDDADNALFTIDGDTLKPINDLPAATYHLHARATDAAGNYAEQAYTFVVVNGPSVTSVVRAGGAGETVLAATGAISYTVTFDQATTGVDAADFTVTGTGTAAGTVTSVTGGGTTYTVTVGSLGGDGTLKLDVNGANTGIQNIGGGPLLAGYTAGQSYVVDRVAPAAPAAVRLTAASDSGRSNSDGVTNITSPVFEGLGEAGATVRLYDGATLIGNGVVGGTGAWNVTATSALTPGAHSITATLTDAVGNVSAVGSAPPVTIDTAAAALAAPTLAPASDSGAQGDRVTNVTRPVLSGVAEAGAQVTLYDTGGTTVLGTAAADASGNWSITSSTLALGVHTLTARQVDVAGNASAAGAALALTIDTSVPAAPGVTSLTTATDSGTRGDGVTSSVTPALTGTGTAGATVVLYDGASAIGSATIGASGRWTVNAAGLAEGSHTIIAVQTNAAGTASAPNAPFTLVIDRTAPTAIGLSNGTILNNAAANAVVGALTNNDSADLGQFTYTLVTGTGDGANGAFTIVDGKLRLTDPSHTAAGGYSVRVKATDTAGNSYQQALAVTVANPVANIDGVAVQTGPVTLPGGGAGTAVIVPVVEAGRADSGGSALTADITLASAGGASALVAHVPVGVGLSATGGASQEAGSSLDSLTAAIAARTADSTAADQSHLTGSGQDFLAQLSGNQALLLNTVVLSGTGSAGGASGSEALVLSGTANGTLQTALVIDTTAVVGNAGGGGVQVTLENVAFAAVIGQATVSGTTNGQTLTGDASAQHFVVGGVASTVIRSGGGDDVLELTAAPSAPSARAVQGAAGALGDLVTPSALLLDGGSGADTVTLGRAQADYTVTRSDGHLVVTDKVSGVVATLINVEAIKFADATLQLDSRAELGVIAALYHNTLGRQADVSGFEFWGDGQRAHGASLGEIALDILGSNESVARGNVLNGNATHDVALLYQALFGRAADAGGAAFWVDAMAHGVTLTQVADGMLASAETPTLAATAWDFHF